MGAGGDAAELAMLDSREASDASVSFRLPPDARTVTAGAGGDPDTKEEDTADASASVVAFASDMADAPGVLLDSGSACAFGVGFAPGGKTVIIDPADSPPGFCGCEEAIADSIPIGVTFG